MTFESFCDRVRFPNNMSRLLRIRCYLLAAQSHCFDYTKHTHKLVPQDVSHTVNENAIVFPDTNALYLGINTLAMNTAPFPELNMFREQCFNAFALVHKRKLTLTQVSHSMCPGIENRIVV